MEKQEYAILGVIALVIVGIGAFTTTEPLGVFLVESTQQP
jgi:hypothetical protein